MRFSGKNRFKVVVVIILGIGLVSCSPDDRFQPHARQDLEAPVCQTPFVPKSSEVKIVGFYPSWREQQLPADSIRWDMLTRVVYAFADVSADGTLLVSDLDITDHLVDCAHAHGVEVYFSVGGAGYSDYFPAMAMNPVSRANFVRGVKNFLFAHCLDGIDIDWEYWSGAADNTVIPEESNALVTLLADLYHEIAPFDIGISVDLYASDWGGKHYFDAITDYADDLQVMAYDFTGWWTDPGPHSSFEDAVGSGDAVTSTGLAYWINYRGWPKEKILLGVPFYGRDFSNNGAGIAYKDIVALYPDAPLYDQRYQIYYNGMATIQQKTEYVIDHDVGGMMIWEIGQDTRDTTSLLNAMYEVVYP